MGTLDVKGTDPRRQEGMAWGSSPRLFCGAS